MVSDDASAHPGDMVITADGILLGVVRSVSEAHLVVGPGEEATEPTWYIPCTAVAAQERLDFTVPLRVTLDQVTAAGWETPPATDGADPTLPAPDVVLASEPDYAGEPYEPGLETDEAYLDPAGAALKPVEPPDGSSLLPIAHEFPT
jgi:hypothetical protein